MNNTINNYVDIIEVSHRINNREEALKLTSLLRIKGVKLNLVTVNPKALAAYNNIIEEKVREHGSVSRFEEFRVASLIERLYKSNITKSTYLDRPESIRNELLKENVEWVIYGKINAKKLRKEKGYTYNKLVEIIESENINVNLHYETKSKIGMIFV